MQYGTVGASVRNEQVTLYSVAFATSSAVKCTG